MAARRDLRTGRWASRAGQVSGWICIAGGLYVSFLTRDWTWLWFSLIGWFLAGSATAEAQQAGEIVEPDLPG